MPAPSAPRDLKTLPAQVAEMLRAEIAGSQWVGTLPGERSLAATFQVSRKTIRRALQELRVEGLLATRPSRASTLAVRKASGPVPAPSQRVALLFPDPLEKLRPFTALWIGGLMGKVQKEGGQLELFHGHKFYGKAADRSLTRLVQANPAKCWVLARSNRWIQEWFLRAGIPVVVAGSAHARIPLASVDLDHRALGRHAAGMFLRHGHRDVALLLDAGDHAGDAETELGFREGLAASGVTEPLVWRIPPSPQQLVQELRRALHLARPPSGFFISNVFSYLTASGWFLAQGLKIPRDLSLVCRQEEPFLAHLHPLPSRYACSPVRFSTALHRAVREAVHGFPSGIPNTRIMPEFLPGESLGACADREK